uniref:Methyltranfer_dom domain-containing protein n=1 Tax=Heterorhabditis bacteriophora TaxID=37862 RepID=A0A1I7XUZ7_HETBA
MNTFYNSPTCHPLSKCGNMYDMIDLSAKLNAQYIGLYEYSCYDAVMSQGLLPTSSYHPHEKFMARNSAYSYVRLLYRFGPTQLLKFFLLLIIGICFLFYLIFFIILSDNIIIDDQYLTAVDDAVLRSRMDFREMTIDRKCSPITTRCYTVVDKKIQNRRGAEHVERHLMVDGFADQSDTVIYLIPPKDEKFDTSDTRIWTIDHLTLNSQYVAGLLIAPFVVSSLSLNGLDSHKSVLEIGLGGGSFDMALSKLKPEINITAVEFDPVVVTLAKKWFGVINTNTRHTIITDGIDYINKASTRGEKYDVVVLDACDTSPLSPCPAESFRNQEIIQVMKSILTDKGCVIVNILSHDEDDGRKTEKVIEIFTDVFPSCLQMKMTDEVNIILICVPYSIGDPKEHMKFYDARLKSAVKTLNWNYILGQITVS